MSAAFGVKEFGDAGMVITFPGLDDCTHLGRRWCERET